jgi:hypothetical protein
MGYTISIKANTKQNFNKMWKFIKTHYIPYNVISGNPNIYVSYPQTRHTQRGLSYAPQLSYIIGFDYNTACLEREFTYTIIRWMSRKVGNNKYFYDSECVPISDKYDELGLLIWEKLSEKEQKSFILQNLYETQSVEIELQKITNYIKHLEFNWTNSY